MGNEIRIFFDGSYNQAFKSAAFIVKHNADTIHQHSANIDVPSSVYAEYKALELALKWAKREYACNKQSITFYGDCKPVVNYVTQFKYLERPKEFALLMDYHMSCRNAYDNLRAFHNVSLQWIPRSLNQEVDTFSRPECQRNGWRYSIIKEINNMIVEYAKKMQIGNIQQTIIDFLTHYTGVGSYKNLSCNQLNFLYTRVLEIKCMIT